MIAVVWQFDVLPGKNEEFERLYGADGPWTALSRRSRSFLGSSFLRDLAQPSRYMVVEYWSEMVVYQRHHADFEDEVCSWSSSVRRCSNSRFRLDCSTRSTCRIASGPTWSQRSGRHEVVRPTDDDMTNAQWSCHVTIAQQATPERHLRWRPRPPAS